MIVEKIIATDGDITVDNGELIRCNMCTHYLGVHGCPGHAYCDYWRNDVMWHGFCHKADKWEEVKGVVRCGECKHYGSRWHGFCELIGNENIICTDDDFCSRGEKE